MTEVDLSEDSMERLADLIADRLEVVLSNVLQSTGITVQELSSQAIIDMESAFTSTPVTIDDINMPAINSIVLAIQMADQ